MNFHSSKHINICFATPSNETSVTLHCDDCSQNSNVQGYQVIAFNISDQYGTLYTNTSNCLETVTVKVETIGIYYVTVFSIEKNYGITKSAIVYMGNYSVGINKAGKK